MFLCGCTHVENVCVPECHDIKQVELAIMPM